IGLQIDLPGSSELVEVVHIVSAEECAQSRENVVERDAERFHFGAVDIDVELRRISGKAAEGAGNQGLVGNSGGERIGLSGQLVHADVAAVFRHQLEAAGVT